MAEFKTVQQLYAQTKGKPLSDDSKQFTLKFPEELPQYKFVTEQLNIFDIIPFRVVNPLHPFVASGSVEADGTTVDDIFMYYEHKNINSRGDSVVCNKMMYGKPCPICEERNRKIEALKAAGVAEPWRDAKVQDLKAKARIMANVIDYRNRDKGIQVLTGSEYVIRQGVLTGAKVNRGDTEDKNYTFLDQGSTFTLEIYDPKLKASKMSEYMYFASPSNGFGIEAECVNDTFDGRDYAKPVRFGLRPRKLQYSNDIVDKAFDLPSFVVQRSYEEVEKLFYGMAKQEEEVVEANANLGIEQTETIQPVATMDVKATSNTAKVQATGEYQATPTIPEAKQALCRHKYRMGLDFETKPECSECLDDDAVEYSACRKLRRTIQSL